MTDLATLVARLQADNSQYIKALDQATSKLSKFQKDQDDLLGGIADKFAAALTVGALTDFASSAIESAASLEKMSQAAGISVENLSSLSLAFAASGLSSDDMGLALKKLNVNLSDAAGNATSKSGEAFRALGISVTNASGSLKDAGTIMGEIADKFATLADGPNKTAIAVQLFGKQGQNLIPILDQGSKGLDDFRAQAEAAGIVVSGSLAAAAEEFEQKFAVLKATLSQGLGNQLAAQLLPVLTEFAEQLTSSSTAGEAFAQVAHGIVVAVQFVAAIVTDTIGAFQRLGTAFGSIGAAAVAAAHGNFSEAQTIIKQASDDNIANRKRTEDQVTAIYAAGTADQLSIISTAEAQKKKIQSEAPNLTSIAESDKAIKELEKFNETIRSQSLAFGLGGAALTNYKLQYGPLADAIKAAGAEGQKLAAEIRANAAVLQEKQDTKAVTDYTNKLQDQITKFGQGSVAASDYATHTGTLGEQLDRLGPAGEIARQKIHDLAVEQVQLQNTDAFFHIDQQLQTLSGHLTQAAAAAFDFNNKLLIKNVAAVGTDAQKAQLDQLKAAEVAQAAFNEQVQKAAIIEQQYATIAADVSLKQAQGTLTDLQAQEQLNAAHLVEIQQLNQVAAAEQNIASSSGLPKLTQDTITFQNSIKNLAAQTNQLEQQVRTGLESSFADNFSQLISGAESFSKAFANIAKSIEKQLDDIVSKNLAQSLFGTGGGAGGLAPLLAGLFGGSSGGSPASSAIGAFTQNGGAGGGIGNIVGSLDGFASGGTLDAGTFGIVGENGPELRYSGAKDMQIVPGGSFGAKPVNVTNHFVVQAAGGQIGRASQMQTAAAAARSLQQASRRNNT